jgi:hypothetical protein
MFNPESNQTACLSCGFGRINGQPSLLNGSFAEVCESCPPGKYSDVVSNTVCKLCPSGHWSTVVSATVSSVCQKCSEYDGLMCPAGTSIPFAGEGLYRTLDDPGTAYPCQPPQGCPAAQLGNTSCANGYSGFRCSKCASRFFRSEGKCVLCMSDIVRWTVMVASGIAILVALFKFSQKESHVPPSIRMVLFWCQFLAVYPSLSAAWPSVLFNFLNFANILNLNIGYLGVECDSGPNSYYSINVVEISLPVIFAGVLTIQRLLSYLMKRVTKVSLLQIAAQAIFISNFLSIQLLSSMFQGFNCQASGIGTYVVRQAPAELCYSDTWIKFVIFDGFMIALYLFVIPSFVIYKFRKAKADGDQHTISVLIHPLTSFYRPGTEFFELFRFFFRVIFVLIRDALPMSSETKITFYMMLLLGMIWVESDLRPYTNRSHQGLSIL